MLVPKFTIPIVAALRYWLSGPFWDWEGYNSFGLHRRARHSIYALLGIMFSILSLQLEPIVIGATAHMVFDPEARFSVFVDRHLAKIAGVIFAVSFLRGFGVPDALPIGAATGFIVGLWLDSVRHIIDTGTAIGSTAHLSNRRQRIFDRYAMSMLAVLAKADGRISEVEIRTIEDFLRVELSYSEAQREFAVQAFRRANGEKLSFEEYAREFYDNFRHDSAIAEGMLELLIRVAVSDGELSAGERGHIATAAWQFGIPDGRLQQLLAAYGFQSRKQSNQQRSDHREENRFQSGADSSTQDHSVLGISPGATQAEIKQAYRKLVKQYHPDSLIGRGLPAQMVSDARKRFQAVQEAYERLSK